MNHWQLQEGESKEGWSSHEQGSPYGVGSEQKGLKIDEQVQHDPLHLRQGPNHCLVHVQDVLSDVDRDDRFPRETSCASRSIDEIWADFIMKINQNSIY